MSKIDELIQVIREEFPKGCLDKEVMHSGYPEGDLEHCADKAKVDLFAVTRKQAIDLFEKILNRFPEIASAELQAYHVPLFTVVEDRLTVVEDRPVKSGSDWNYCLEFRIEDPDFEFMRLKDE